MPWTWLVVVFAVVAGDVVDVADAVDVAEADVVGAVDGVHVARHMHTPSTHRLLQGSSGGRGSSSSGGGGSSRHRGNGGGGGGGGLSSPLSWLVTAIIVCTIVGCTCVLSPECPIRNVLSEMLAKRWRRRHLLRKIIPEERAQAADDEPTNWRTLPDVQALDRMQAAEARIQAEFGAPVGTTPAGNYVRFHDPSSSPYRIARSPPGHLPHIHLMRPYCRSASTGSTEPATSYRPKPLRALRPRMATVAPPQAMARTTLASSRWTASTRRRSSRC